jgi:hypothetical protein
MSKALVAALLLFAISGAGCTSVALPPATDDGTAYAWCTNYMTDTGTNCGFTSLQQCLETSLAGTRGLCYPNGRFRPAPGPGAVTAN